MLARAERRVREGMRSAKALPKIERLNLRGKLEQDVWHSREALLELEDKALVAKARKMDIYLDEIPIPSPIEGLEKSHFMVGDFGNEILQDETRNELVKRVRERGPAYRKEQRERVDLLVRIATAVTGMLGTIIGLVAVLKR